MLIVNRTAQMAGIDHQFQKLRKEILNKRIMIA